MIDRSFAIDEPKFLTSSRAVRMSSIDNWIEAVVVNAPSAIPKPFAEKSTPCVVSELSRSSLKNVIRSSPPRRLTPRYSASSTIPSICSLMLLKSDSNCSRSTLVPTNVKRSELTSPAVAIAPSPAFVPNAKFGLAVPLTSSYSISSVPMSLPARISSSPVSVLKDAVTREPTLESLLMVSINY